MTAQFSERLRFEGEDVAMRTTPLSDYFAMSGIDPCFEWKSTALWRGYVGRWEIVDDRLYLVELKGTLKDGTEASVATFFPEFPDRVFAHWYSGTIRIPRGKQLKYVHMGFASVFEQDLLLDLERGVVTNTRIRQNGTAPQDAPEGYEVGAMTVFRRTGSDDGGAP